MNPLVMWPEKTLVLLLYGLLYMKLCKLYKLCSYQEEKEETQDVS